MQRCICGGMYLFCKEYKKGKVPKDVHTFKCPCGQYLYIIENTLWYEGYSLDLSKIQENKDAR